MLIQGQIELSCAFGRIGCLDAEIYLDKPYRIVTIPLGTRWYQGAEYMRLRGISRERAGLRRWRKPDWIIELPPDWEAIAIWDGEERRGELWADYGGHRDLTGLVLDSFLELSQADPLYEAYDWWEDWFKLPTSPIEEAGVAPSIGAYEFFQLNSDSVNWASVLPKIREEED